MEKVNNMCEQMGNFKNFKSKLEKKKRPIGNSRNKKDSVRNEEHIQV